MTRLDNCSKDEVKIILKVRGLVMYTVILTKVKQLKLFLCIYAVVIAPPDVSWLIVRDYNSLGVFINLNSKLDVSIMLCQSLIISVVSIQKKKIIDKQQHC